MQTITLDALSHVTGGAGLSAKWNEIRAQAQPHCPQTVARYSNAPTSRTQAERIGSACIAEMGSFKAAMGGREKIQAGIDAAFPR
jgi:hypothetical protein